MGIADRRKIYSTGRYTRAITIPASLRMGETATLAAGVRLLLVDPTGETPEGDLLKFLEEIEPRFLGVASEGAAAVRLDEIIEHLESHAEKLKTLLAMLEGENKNETPPEYKG